MLAYAPARHRPTASKSTLMLIVGAHVAVVALALAARFEVERRAPAPPIDVINIKTPKPPPPPEPTVEPRTSGNPISQIDTTNPLVLIPTTFPDDAAPIRTPPGPIAGTEMTPPHLPPFVPPPIARTKAVLKTAGVDLRPPYPDGKRLSEEEATLKLKLSIDNRGRVVAVQPVGDVDRAFLEAARRHILRFWRYTPATESGEAVHSSTIITLQFQLDG